MTIGNVIRVMEEKDLLEVPNARKLFEKFQHDFGYFFFVIEDDSKEIVGYLIAKSEGTKVVIRELYFSGAIKEKYLYQNTAFSNLYEYIRKIRNCNGERIFYQVSIP